MHPAWYIDDLRYLIFEYLQPQEFARLAQCSQALSHLTIPPLWNTLSSFKALICCLPPDFDRRPLQVEDIQRLDFYTSMVLELKVEKDIDAGAVRLPAGFAKQTIRGIRQRQYRKTWEELWEEVAAVRPPSKLFCNLRELRINNVVEQLLLPLVGISGNHLTKVNIKFFRERQANSPIYRVLNGFSEAPCLEYLFVRDGESGHVPASLVRKAPLKHLRLNRRSNPKGSQLSVYQESTIQAEALKKATLEHLSIGLNPNWYTHEISVLEGKHLPALETLWLDLSEFQPAHLWGSCGNGADVRWSCDSCSPTARPPTQFFELLDNPELSLLRIKFPHEVNSNMIADVLSAADRNCQLKNLVELCLAGVFAKKGLFQDPPKTQPEKLRKILQMLLPLPKLKVLQLSVAPNFLDVLDLNLYQTLAEGLLSLESLSLGHPNWIGWSYYIGRSYYEKVPVRNIAAFCKMLPALRQITFGSFNPNTPVPAARPEFTCHHIKTVCVENHAKESLREVVTFYFPNAEIS